MDKASKKAMKQKLLGMKEQIYRQLVSESDEFQEIVDAVDFLEFHAMAREQGLE